MAEGARLESVYTARYPGFESLSLRHKPYDVPDSLLGKRLRQIHMALTILLNGNPKEVNGLEEGAALSALILALSLKADRVAVEHNGAIAPRRTWDAVSIYSGDKLEVVHFVGGGK